MVVPGVLRLYDGGLIYTTPLPDYKRIEHSLSAAIRPGELSRRSVVQPGFPDPLR